MGVDMMKNMKATEYKSDMKIMVAELRTNKLTTALDIIREEYPNCRHVSYRMNNGIMTIIFVDDATKAWDDNTNNLRLLGVSKLRKSRGWNNERDI